MYDPCRHYHGGADTSEVAWELTAKGKRLKDAQKILHYIQGCDGATCDQVEVALGLSHQTASARITDLVQGGLIWDTGKRRATRTGSPARVYQITTGKQMRLV